MEIREIVNKNRNTIKRVIEKAFKVLRDSERNDLCLKLMDIMDEYREVSYRLGKSHNSYFDFEERANKIENEFVNNLNELKGGFDSRLINDLQTAFFQYGEAEKDGEKTIADDEYENFKDDLKELNGGYLPRRKYTAKILVVCDEADGSYLTVIDANREDPPSGIDELMIVSEDYDMLNFIEKNNINIFTCNIQQVAEKFIRQYLLR